MDTLSNKVAQIKAPLLPAQGVPATASDPATAQFTYPEDDMLSTAASCSFFTEEEEQGVDEVSSLAS